MKTALRSLGLLTFSAFLLAGSTGCEAACTDDPDTGGTTCTGKSLTKFTGDPVNKTAEWTPGTDIKIESNFGEITVIQGASNTVEVTYEPFSYRAHDAEPEARDDIALHFKTEEIGDANGVIVKHFRDGGGSSLGANMTVKIPPNFDGKLWVTNHGNGDVSNDDGFDADVDFVGNAFALEVRANADIGSCHIQGAPSVKHSVVDCGDFVRLNDVSDHVNIRTRFGANTDDAVNFRIVSVSPDAPDSIIETEDGTVAADFPATGNYSIQAHTTQGVVSVGDTSCGVQVASEGSKTVTCGSGGPNYVINAGKDSLGDSHVNLAFK